ncbi:asparaginase [Streptomyces alanosinicus]|uniref:L-asparaginase n=1 Tax=Streptomyces alanosinicus TaxID=68171 RepID=A0A918YQA9_9ACTN|nr:asparaginase [Streptomyces alanosinicus]GHE11953.1 L-asparaginase [Streptomyces alanosinicus]
MNSADPTLNRKLLVLTLGGTIAMTHTGASVSGVVPNLTGADLVAAVPGLREVAEIVVEDFRQMPGASLTINDIVSLVQRLAQADHEGFHGVVVTQGTDTLEETAYLTDLYYQGSAPVVFTGAMRTAAAAGADGPANLLASAQTAVASEVRGMGVLVVLSDEIHAARHVRKMHTTSTGAFASPQTGPVGYVEEGNPHVRGILAPVPPVPRPSSQLPRVELVTATLGSDGLLLDGLEDKLDGLVIAAFGVGHVPESWCARLEALADRMPVVLASRIGAGPILNSTYAFPGSESDLRSRGLIGAGTLDPYKARLLLGALLAAGSSRSEIAKAFRERH